MIKRIMEEVLIVGTGVTGALTAAMLRSQLPKTTKITLWDKANGAGGRMSTSRGPVELNSTVDLGAQYISSSPVNYQTHKRLYDELCERGVLQTLPEVIEGDRNPPDTRHFVTPEGVSSLVKYFLIKSDAALKFNYPVRDIEQQGKKWAVRTDGGQCAQFDAVVVTIPVPQILELRGTIKDKIESQPKIHEKMKKVSFSSRFALGMFYKPGTRIDVPWRAKYVFDDPCVRFIAIDDRKRGAESSDVGPSLCVHTSVPFSLQHLEEDKETVCKELVLPRVRHMIPELPEPDSVKCHKWRYSQVFQAYEGKPGAVVLQEQPLLVLGGDAFTDSGFDNCIKSATRLSEEVVKFHKHSRS